MKKHYYIVVLLMLMLLSRGVCAQPVAVVVNQNINTDLSIEQLQHIFLGRVSILGDNSRIKPVVLPQRNELHRAFSAFVLNRSAAQLKAYWARNLFTGKGELPTVAANVDQVKTLIADSDSYIGYVPLDQVDERLRVIYVFDLE